MGSLAPPLAVRAGAAVEGAEPSEEQPELHQQQQQQQQGQQGQQQRREKKPKPPPPPRPTHFLALQLSQHPGVAAAIATVQASLRHHSPHLKKACVEVASAHLTLGVMALNSEDERARAAEVLAALAQPLRQAALLAPVQVQLEGLSHFKNQVLYLDVRPDGGLEQLMALAAAARAHFKDAGLLLQADQPFVPHVTIAKTSKLQGWGNKGHGRGGRGHGHGRGHGGSKHERHDWRADRREERRAKQQRLEMQGADDEALAGMDWGRAGEEGNDGASGGNKSAAGSALPAADQLAEAGTDAAGMEAPASAAVLPASATEPPSSSNYNGSSMATAAAAAAAGEGEGGTGQPEEDEPQRSQQAPHGGRKWQHEGEGAADLPTHHSGGGWRQIDAEAWAQHAAIVGGSVLLAELQLCAMQGRKPEEYYPVLCSLPLTPGEAAAAAAPPAGEGQAGAAGGVQVEGVEAATELLEASEDAGPATQPAVAPCSAPEAAAPGS